MIDHAKVHQRFWRKVVPEPNTGCWLWVGAQNRRGYGNIVDKRNRFTWTAHRYFYTALRQPISPGMTLDHLCRTTCCVNPAHMEEVTKEENTRRQAQRRCVTTGRFISSKPLLNRRVDAMLLDGIQGKEH